MSEAPLANTPEARTETGALIDQTPTPVTTTTTLTETQPSGETPAPTGEAASLLNQEEPAGAPETYEPFKVPNGVQPNEEAFAEAGKLFKEMNLPQAEAQKLIDFHLNQLKASADAPYREFQATREAWVKEVKADPEIGPKLAQVKQTIGSALNSLGDPALSAQFKAVMDSTGAGDNPAFIKAFYKLAQRVTEGSHVQGRGPAEVIAPGGRRPSPAQAMYPNLPSSAVPQ